MTETTITEKDTLFTTPLRDIKCGQWFKLPNQTAEPFVKCGLDSEYKAVRVSDGILNDWGSGDIHVFRIPHVKVEY
jgi:hypothetical protein